ncbi:hypothetical protein EVAR_40756_1 [Eumeta japonica]|uniref:Uncharacterized protein n=1 Tax=Eumeta variegata TaxID=151549 RepID=A0A4C1X523_EUMVA|nr:hypothetical protein EVAR_40756_1 [Eumeta japonica]
MRKQKLPVHVSRPILQILSDAVDIVMTSKLHQQRVRGGNPSLFWQQEPEKNENSRFGLGLRDTRMTSKLSAPDILKPQWARKVQVPLKKNTELHPLNLRENTSYLSEEWAETIDFYMVRSWHISLASLTSINVFMQARRFPVPRMITINILLCIDCFKCVSVNGRFPPCDDPFHNNHSLALIESPCMGGRKGRDGLFPATSCVKIAGVYDDTEETITVRGCALDSSTATTDTEIVRMSHCGRFYYNDSLKFATQLNEVTSPPEHRKSFRHTFAGYRSDPDLVRLRASVRLIRDQKLYMIFRNM